MAAESRANMFLRAALLRPPAAPSKPSNTASGQLDASSATFFSGVINHHEIVRATTAWRRRRRGKEHAGHDHWDFYRPREHMPKTFQDPSSGHVLWRKIREVNLLADLLDQ